MPPETKRFKRGLIVGKFSPLHLGHEWLIKQAQSECDELVLLSWSQPELAGCESARRRHWLRQRFGHLQALVLDRTELARLAEITGVSAPPLPDNDAPEIEAREFVGWVCENVLRYIPDVVFTSEHYGDGFAEELTRYFNKRELSSDDVVHRCIDQPRNRVPISGTVLRGDPHAQRAFLAPEVYADFVEKIVLLGGESAGKTTLALALSKALNTHWVPEYGRELWVAKAGELEFTDMVQIAEAQIAREQQLAQSANKFLICDTSPLTTHFYSLAMFDRVDPALSGLAERDYQRVFLCAADFEFVQDGTRRNSNFRQEQQRWYQQHLDTRNIPYIILRGSVEARVEQVLKVLDQDY